MGSRSSDESDRTYQSSPVDPRTLRPHGGYRRLRSFHVAEIIYDATVAFCDRFIDKRSRTNDQMVQSARSGRQNIAEGSRASGTSSQTELRLVGVARASLDELLLDYEDFLRHRRLPLWGKDHPNARQVRDIAKENRTDRTDPTDRSDDCTPQTPTPYDRYRALVESAEPETAANTVICLIHQVNFLLDRQIQELEREFIERGGYSEQLAAARRSYREGVQTEPDDRSDPAGPACPKCGKAMVLRTARKGPRAGSRFWGCPGYPDCKGTLPKTANDP
jgi:restriction system protein